MSRPVTHRPIPGRRERLRWKLLQRIPQSILLHPFEVYIAGLAVLSGAPLLIGKPGPETINAVLPLWLVRVWGTMLITGALLVLIGLLRPRGRLERLGHTLLAPASLVYGLAIIAAIGWRGLIAGFIVTGFGLACMTRAYVLRLADDVLLQVLRDSAEQPSEPA